jgi:hypothetical protein
MDHKNTADLNTDVMNRRTVSLDKKHGLWLLTKDMAKNIKEATYKHAEAYCKQKKCGSKRALADNPVWKEHISHRALTRRLKGEVKTGSEWSANAVLTNTERRELAAALNSAGRQMCGFDLNERNQAVVDILLYRQALNKRPDSGGRAYKKLSKSARRVLENGKAGIDFWKSFFAEFKHMVYITKEKVTSIIRLKMCSEEVALQHLSDFKALLASKGIYDLDNDCFFPGKEGNLIRLDEMGQFFNFLLRKGTALNVVGATGFPSKSAAAENRQQFTYDCAIGGDMFLYAFHLIFRAEHFMADMGAPCLKDHPFSMISVTPKGCQVGSTFLARLKGIVKEARARGITGDIVFATDGHASRFHTEVLRWLDQSMMEDPLCDTGHDIGLTKANSTGTCCVCDQFFQEFHRVYGGEVNKLKKEQGLAMTIGRYEATMIVGHMHATWLSMKMRQRSWRVCGFNMEGLPVGEFTTPTLTITLTLTPPIPVVRVS